MSVLITLRVMEKHHSEGDEYTFAAQSLEELAMGKLSLCAIVLSAAFLSAQETPLPHKDYAVAMRKVAAQFKGRPGVVLHIGDSITYANPYGQWARSGKGKTADDIAVLKWMHAGADNDRDGWWLAAADLPGGRSYTACGGIRADEILAGGKSDMPPLSELLATYRPQVVVLMLGTNDVSAGRKSAATLADMTKAVDLILDDGVVCILSTIPPHFGRPALAKSYNASLRKLAKERGLPLIDFEREILTRRPDDWNGTLLGKNDVHPTVGPGADAAPTAENLKNSGYLLRGWLSVKKIAEVKKLVLDGLPGNAPATSPLVPKPQGEMVKAAVTRDTWFSNVDAEANGNCGGAHRLKLKSIQEMSLVDIDAAPFRGRVIRGATLHVRSTGEPRLQRVTVSSFGAEWVEGTASGYQPQQGSSTHNRRRHPDVLWAGPGSDLCSVMLGQGGTFWRMADASKPDAAGWQKIAIEPAVVAARVAGLSYGFLLFDDTGTEWTRNGEQFKIHLFPNRFVYSREAGPESAPFMTVFLGPEDKTPPDVPTGLVNENVGLPAGEVMLSWITPKDNGPAGTLGFFVTVNDKEVPRYLIPLAGKPGERVSMRLRDLGLEPGSSAVVAVKAVDGAGNIGEAIHAKVEISGHKVPVLPGKPLAPFNAIAALPTLGDAGVAVIDELDKVQPLTGEMIPKQPENYLAANHLWSAKDRLVRLHAARNEFVAFQVLFRDAVKGLKVSLAFEGDDEIPNAVSWYLHVKSKKGPLPDPIVPLGNVALDMAANTSLHCELYVPHKAAVGPRKGKLTLQSGRQSLALDISLEIWDFTLPDYLSFLPEMNAYDLPENERDYYRLAHMHRTVLNKVPYYQSGEVQPGCAPGWNGRALSWQAFDQRFGPLFTGQAFADLPRRSVPLECFYLPLNENWPTRIAGNYNGNYWADRAFPERYRRDFVEVSRQFAAHAVKAEWSETLFHFFLNGKNTFKENGWSRASSPWLLDEPSNFQDFWALRWFGAAFHEGVSRVKPGAKMLFRADISQPQWQRDTFDGLLDYNVVSGAFRHHHRMVLDRKRTNGEIVLEYGGTNAIEDSNVQPLGWSLDAWALGADGVLPWNTMGSEGSWTDADELALFYPGKDNGPPTASIRLKAYRRGQQDVEYLTLLMREMKEPRWAVGQAVRTALKLSAERKSSQAGGVEDAGVITYAQLKPQDVWALRTQIGAALSDAKPKPLRRLRKWETPRRDPASLAGGYVSVGEVPDVSPTAPAVVPVETGATKVLQGRSAVQDVLIDPAEPLSKLGRVPRGNALSKAKESGAFLVRFELDGLKLAKDAKIKKATVSFFVWDPSSQGNTKVVAFGLKTAWTETEASWRQPADGRKWKGGDHFSLVADAGEPGNHVIVKPDGDTDTVDPPLEYQIDVTDLVKKWQSGAAPNQGVALVPVPDRAVDDGQFTRFQIYASEYNEAKYGPKLTVTLGP